MNVFFAIWVVGFGPIDIQAPGAAAFLPAERPIAEVLSRDGRLAKTPHLPWCFTVRGLQGFGRVDVLEEYAFMAPGKALHVEISEFGVGPRDAPMRPRLKEGGATPCKACLRLSLTPKRVVGREVTFVWSTMPENTSYTVRVKEGEPTAIEGYVDDPRGRRRVIAIVRPYVLGTTEDAQRVRHLLKQERVRLAKHEAARQAGARATARQGPLHYMYRQALWLRSGKGTPPWPLRRLAPPQAIECGPKYVGIAPPQED